MMTTPLMLDHVVAYASQVRFCLRDLGPEQVEGLTGGLEADLAEAIEDPDGRPITGEIPVTPHPASSNGAAGPDANSPEKTVIDLTPRFGTPEAYAAELRLAAGLPPARPTPADQQGLQGLLARSTEWLHTVLRTTDDGTQPDLWTATQAAFRTVQPLWSSLLIWVLANLGLQVFFGIDLVPAVLIGFGFIALLTVLSVRFRRGTWVPKHGLRHTSRYLNALAVILLVPVLVAAQWQGQEQQSSIEYVQMDGGQTTALEFDEFDTASALYVDGFRATNLFVYGPDGEFIDGARILDQDGRPVRIGQEDSQWDPNLDIDLFWEPRTDAAGTDVWNAYPLGFWTSRMASWDEDTGEWALPEGVNAQPQVPPIASLNELELADEDEPDGDSSESPSPKK